MTTTWVNRTGVAGAGDIDEGDTYRRDHEAIPLPGGRRSFPPGPRTVQKKLEKEPRST